MELKEVKVRPETVPLRVEGLTAAYRDEPVLWDVSFEVPQGELVAVVGPNGAGKTTLLKVVMGLMEPAAGRALVYGKPFEKARQWVGYVPQRGSVDWDFPTSALDVAQMGLYGKLGWFRRPGRKEREKAMECLEKVGIAHLADRQISQLSGGQQQRVFLARALAQDARLYLTDEPFAAVDYKTERAIVALLRELKSQGSTVIVVHHDLATVPDYFDRVVILNKRLVAEGPVSEVFTKENVSEAYGGAVGFLAGSG
ncbi:MAG: Manganese ABC transporter, ATP-binding protein SitB [uncultured Rubrobacteraceae bacterium]|uniref:Manganese ABC transporter, ATP-binding protein SitB n=1 Tax=uncultured Rubrobacteraceae bacterium TaxID=349277 RepID=A0A6J4R1T0_9ACTN|nr:MAG: Manganese ABC transporter, ATP-binding protein SitB [uncultured Rubrobacteraceae bacterium]